MYAPHGHAHTHTRTHTHPPTLTSEPQHRGFLLEDALGLVAQQRDLLVRERKLAAGRGAPVAGVEELTQHRLVDALQAGGGAAAERAGQQSQPVS